MNLFVFIYILKKIINIIFNSKIDIIPSDAFFVVQYLTCGRLSIVYDYGFALLNSMGLLENDARVVFRNWL